MPMIFLSSNDEAGKLALAEYTTTQSALSINVDASSDSRYDIDIPGEQIVQYDSERSMATVFVPILLSATRCDHISNRVGTPFRLRSQVSGRSEFQVKDQVGVRLLFVFYSWYC